MSNNRKESYSGSKSCHFLKNEEVEVYIEDIGSDGEGIGHIDGFTLFIKGALPGDTVCASIMKMKKNYGYARLVRIISPSKDRVNPVCSNAFRCGGCQLQHLSYEGQLALKSSRVKNCLVRLGGFKEDYIESITEPILAMDSPYNYRNKAQFPVGRGKNGKPVIGFYAGRSHDIIDSDSCCIQMEVSNTILEIVRKWMIDNKIQPYDETSHTGTIRHIVTRTGYNTGDIMVCLVSRMQDINCLDKLVSSLTKIKGMKSICLNINDEKTNRILGEKLIPLYGTEYIEDAIGTIRYRISPLSFYQVNPLQTEKLYSTALEYANLTGGEIVWDLYCGIGTISLFLAGKASRVLGIEVVPQAIINAKENARLNNINNTTFIAGVAEEVESLLSESDAPKELASPDVIVVDPPRKGCDEKLLNTILRAKPQRVVYVSCDPATLARDLKVLCGEGKYELKRVRACDMFGMTGHVETVVLLSR